MAAHGTWRMNFATNPTKPGIADRDDQWFCAGHDQGVRSFSYGTAARTGGGGFTYTVVGAADSGNFDLTDRSVTVKVDVAKLNAVQTHGPITSTRRSSACAGRRSSSAMRKPCRSSRWRWGCPIRRAAAERSQ